MHARSHRFLTGSIDMRRRGGARHDTVYSHAWLLVAASRIEPPAVHQEMNFFSPRSLSFAVSRMSSFLHTAKRR